MTSPGVVYVDETVDLYRNLRLPDNWTIHYEPVWGSLGASMRWCYENYPDATQYGWLADDTVPRTEGWDKNLEAEAGKWFLSHARDLWFSEEPSNCYELQIGDNLSSGLCWGGDLVRTVGWWALPGVVQAGIDTAWCAIVGPLCLIRYLEEVIVEHKNYRTGKREMDSVDDWEREGVNYIHNDIQVRNAWAASPEYRDIIAKVREYADVKLTPFQQIRLRQKIRDQRVSELWKIGSPAVRLTNLLEAVDAELDQLVANILHPDPDVEPAG